MTPIAGKSQIEKAWECGVNDYLTKPFNIIQLSDLLDRYLSAK